MDLRTKKCKKCFDIYVKTPSKILRQCTYSSIKPGSPICQYVLITIEKGFEKVKQRILGSLKNPVYNTPQKKAKNKEFWFGFLVALSDYHNISHEDYKKLRNMVDGW